jgi:apolipoprotein N-acyltransferase
MTTNLWRYRLAGAAGGLMLAAGNLLGPLCLLQLGALVPLLVLFARDKKIGPAILAGFYMGLTFALPQMIYLCMPVPVTAILLVEFVILLIVLMMLACWAMRRGTVLGCFAFGAAWFLLDWLNYTAIPIWGMAQSLARSWTTYPFLIGFISITGISGVVFVVGTVQALIAHSIVTPARRKVFLSALAAMLLLITLADILPAFQRPGKTMRIAAAGWIFDDRSKTDDPHTEDGFRKVFADPAARAAADGARIFTTGELGFYIADHNRAEWFDRFAAVARDNHLALVVGYFNITAAENRIFYMNPQGEVVAEYTKSHLTPLEPGKKGTGDLKTMEVDGIPVGGMICQDDNFSTLTRHYGRNKTPLIFCPTADWWTIKNAHLQAVRARAIECRYAIARGAANGISAIISPGGRILAKRDHYAEGAGYVIADVPLVDNVTPFARFGHMPMVIVSAAILFMYVVRTPTKQSD